MYHKQLLMMWSNEVSHHVFVYFGLLKVVHLCFVLERIYLIIEFELNLYSMSCVMRTKPALAF